MTYFIVQAPYDKCFDLFFKTELGYPNFYRMTELLSPDQTYQNLTLIAPYPTKEPPVLEKIKEKVNSMNVKCLSFGEDLETAFLFDEKGQLQTHPAFKTTLSHKVMEFLQTYPSPSESESFACPTAS